jgi:hypothetical protein
MGIGVALVLGEVLVRASQWSVNRRNLTQGEYRKYADIYVNVPGAAYLYGHKPNAKVTLRSGSETYTFVSNSEGLREKNEFGALPASVVFVGDSVVEGASVENHQTMDSVFEKITGIPTLNFGIGSSNTVQEYHFLAAKYDARYHTRLIVLGFCLNDLEQNIYLRRFSPALGNWELDTRIVETERAQTERPSLTQRLRGVVRQSALATLVYASIAEWRAPPQWSAARARPDEIAQTDRYLRKMQDFARSINAAFVVVLFPTESQMARAYGPGERTQDMIIPLLNRHEIPYLDLYEPLKQQTQRLQVTFAQRGKEIANEIASMLLELVHSSKSVSWSTLDRSTHLTRSARLAQRTTRGRSLVSRDRSLRS